MLSLTAQIVEPGNRAELSVEIERFLDQSIPKLKSDTPDRAKLAAELANLAVALGELQSLRQIEAARMAWRRVEGLLKPFAETQEGSILTPLARAQLYLGDLPGAQALAARIQRTSYRHPAYADLVKQLQSVRGGGTPIETAGAKQ